MRPAFLLLSLALISCGPRRNLIEGAPLVDVDEARESLVLPPDSDSREALKQLEALANTGDVRAGWLVAHYYVDLFDASRFESDPDRREKTRALLFAGLDVAPGSGPVTTNLVLDAMLVKVDRVLRADRLHAGAQAAKTLLEYDRKRPIREELFARMVALKAIARGTGPLRANASLRLGDFCRSAFRDAVRAPTPYRPGILTYCLYPLYDSDPEPYFAPDPAKRPPEPAWKDLAMGVQQLYADVGKAKSRISILGGELSTEEMTFLKAKQSLLPSAPTPAELGVPLVARAQPYEWTPLVRLGDGSQPPSPELNKKLAPIVAADRRGRVAISLTSSAPATTALTGAQAAVQAGADTIELIVGYEQTVKAPSGDYWHGRSKDDRVARLGVLALALEPLGATPVAATPGRQAPRASDWDPARATLGLHLDLAPGTWKLLSPAGALAEIPAAGTSAKPTEQLREELEKLRDAFPDEDGLVIVPEAGTTYAQLIGAAEAAHTDKQGKPLFRALALGARLPTVAAKGDLRTRVARRVAATVSIAPDALAARAPAVRQCYQDALDRSPKLTGVMTIQLSQPVKQVPAGAQVISGPSDKPLRICLTQALGPAMVSGAIQNVRVTLQVRSHP
jgi:hypothetical protein